MSSHIHSCLNTWHICVTLIILLRHHYWHISLLNPSLLPSYACAQSLHWQLVLRAVVSHPPSPHLHFWPCRVTRSSCMSLSCCRGRTWPLYCGRLLGKDAMGQASSLAALRMRYCCVHFPTLFADLQRHTTFQDWVLLNAPLQCLHAPAPQHISSSLPSWTLFVPAETSWRFSVPHLPSHYRSNCSST